MKNAIIGATMIIVMVLLSLIHMSITTTDVRQSELDKALNSAVRTTMEIAKTKETYPIETEEEFIAEFNKNLLSSISSDSDIEVQVMGVDLEEGMLDVKVISKFKFPTGADGQVSSRKTVILDEEERKKDVEMNYSIHDYEGNGYYKITNKELIANSDTGFSSSKAIVLNSNFKKGEQYKIEIDMFDSNNSFYGGHLSGNIILAGNEEKGEWKSEGTKSIYTFTASQDGNEARLFSGGFYVDAKKVSKDTAFGSLKIYQVK